MPQAVYGHSLLEIASIASRYKKKRAIQRLLNVIEGRISYGANKQLTVGVVGAFSRGKSSLINALLDVEILPASVLPATAIPTQLVYGEIPKLHALSAGKKIFAGNVDLINKFLATNIYDGKKIDSLIVELSSQLLTHDIILIDTPGIGAVDTEHYYRTKDVLTECDAVIFVFSTDPLLSEVECKFIEELQDVVEISLFVQTKIDKYDDWQLKFQYNEMVLRNLLHSENLKVFPLSCVKILPSDVSSETCFVAKSNLNKLFYELTGMAHVRTEILERKNKFLVRELAWVLDAYFSREFAQLKVNISKAKLDIVVFKTRLNGIAKMQRGLKMNILDLIEKIENEIANEAGRAKELFLGLVSDNLSYDEVSLNTIFSKTVGQMNRAVEERILQESQSLNLTLLKNIGPVSHNWFRVKKIPKQGHFHLVVEKVYVNKEGDKTGWGAVIGGGLGTVLFPGLGTVIGVSLGALLGRQIKNELILNNESIRRNILSQGCLIIDERAGVLTQIWREVAENWRSIDEANLTREIMQTSQKIEKEKGLLMKELNHMESSYLQIEKDLEVVERLKKG